MASSGKTLTKVTLESFLAWKKRKLREKSDQAEKAMAKKKEAFRQGKTLGISGREMFMFNPELVGGDEDTEGGDVVQMMAEEGEGEEEVVVDVTTNFLTVMASESSATAAAPVSTMSVKSEGVASSEDGTCVHDGDLERTFISELSLYNRRWQ